MHKTSSYITYKVNKKYPFRNLKYMNVYILKAFDISSGNAMMTRGSGVSEYVGEGAKRRKQSARNCGKTARKRRKIARI